MWVLGDPWDMTVVVDNDRGGQLNWAKAVGVEMVWV